MATPQNANATTGNPGGDRVLVGRASTRHNATNNPRQRVTRRPAARNAARDLSRGHMRCSRTTLVPLIEMGTDSDED